MITTTTSTPHPTAAATAASARETQAPPARSALLAGRALSALAVLFLALDAVGKVLRVPATVEGTTTLGYPASVIVPLGVLQVVLLVAYLVPRTAVLGAILWTGYLGGAVATHVRLLNPVTTHILFPVYVGALLWLGLWLRDPRVRAVLPLRPPR